MQKERGNGISYICIYNTNTNVMANKAKLRLTSVKLVDHLFEDFKISSIRHKFNLQKLVHSSMELYNNSENFRKLMHNPNTSGSYSL